MNFLIVVLFSLYKLVTSLPVRREECQHPPLNQLIFQYSKAYTQQLDLISQNAEANFLQDEISIDHFPHYYKTHDNIGCKYTIKSIYRQQKFPYLVKQASLLDNNPISIGSLQFKCKPISYLQPVLVQANVCKNGFYKFQLQYETIVIKFKLVLV